MKVKVATFGTGKPADIELNDAVFGIEPRVDVIQRVTEWQRANAQSGSHATLERNSVRGTTKKPFKQKGTGNARQGSLKGPHQRGGGVAHGPRVRSHGYNLNKKVRQLGLRSALSAKAKDGKLVIIDSIDLKDAKTKDLVKKLEKLSLTSALFIEKEGVNANFQKAANNIPHIDALPSVGTNVYDILRHDTLVLTVDAAKQLEERLA